MIPQIQVPNTTGSGSDCCDTPSQKQLLKKLGAPLSGAKAVMMVNPATGKTEWTTALNAEISGAVAVAPDRVLSGMATTQDGADALQANVAAGAYQIGGTKYTLAVADTATATDGDPINPRWDVVTINAAGAVAVTAGAPAATPVPPAIAAGLLALAVMFVPAGAVAGSTDVGFYPADYTNNAVVDFTVSENTASLGGNVVFVRTATDFPAAIAGVRTLVANTVYVLLAPVDIGASYLLATGVVSIGIVGLDPDVSTLTGSHASGNLIVNDDGTNLYVSTIGLSSSDVSFTTGASGGYKRFRDCVFTECEIVFAADIGVAPVFEMSRCFGNNSSGKYVTAAGLGGIDVSIKDCVTYTAVAAATQFDFSTTAFAASTANVSNNIFYGVPTAVALDFTGATFAGAQVSIVLEGNSFRNEITPVASYGGNEERALVAANAGLPDLKAYATMAVTVAAPTTPAGASTPLKLLGTTALGVGSVFTAVGDNRLRYDGIVERRFRVTISNALYSGDTTDVLRLYLGSSIDGVVAAAAGTEFAPVTLVAGAAPYPLVLQATVSLQTSGYVEMWGSNETDNSNIQLDSAQFTIEEY